MAEMLRTGAMIIGRGIDCGWKGFDGLGTGRPIRETTIARLASSYQTDIVPVVERGPVSPSAVYSGEKDGTTVAEEGKSVQTPKASWITGRGCASCAIKAALAAAVALLMYGVRRRKSTSMASGGVLETETRSQSVSPGSVIRFPESKYAVSNDL